MSVHKSLVAKGRLKRHRNVLTRTERIGRLEDEEKWEPEKDSVFCLPKVRVAKLKKSHAKKKEAEGDEAVEGAAAEGAAAAKPAADK
jgi:small basic protein (TIGR04137 family)